MPIAGKFRRADTADANKHGADTVRFAGNCPPIADSPDPPSETLYVTAPNKETLKFRHWYPIGQAPDPVPKKAPVVLLVHALSGRSSWMTPLVKRLMRDHPEFRFYGLDLPYIGEHPYEKGQIKDSRQPVAHVQQAIAALAERHDREVYAIGLSLGGLLVSLAAADPHPKMAGVVALSPGYMPNRRILNGRVVGMGAWHSLMGLLGRRSGEVNFKLADKAPTSIRKSAEKMDEVTEKISDKIDETIMESRSSLQQKIRREKSEGRNKINGLTAKSYLRIFRMMTRMYAQDARKIKIPYRLYLSETDDVIGVKWAQKRIYPKVKSKDKGMTIYPDAEHDFNTDPGLDQVAGSISVFLERLNRTRRDNG